MTIEEALEKLDEVLPEDWSIEKIYRYPLKESKSAAYMTKESEKLFGHNPRFHIQYHAGIKSSWSSAPPRVYIRRENLVEALQVLIEYLEHNTPDWDTRLEL